MAAAAAAPSFLAPSLLRLLPSPLRARCCSSSSSRSSPQLICAALHSDPYHTLGVHVGAPELVVKNAYRRLALKFHPDVCKEASSVERFMQINQAYESVLKQLKNDEEKWIAETNYRESMMGVSDNSWEDWEEWMGWEGAGTRDYSSHINYSL